MGLGCVTEVEGDVDPTGLLRDRVGVAVDRLLVESVDLGGFGPPPVARIASATSSSVAWVRPARNTLAPSRPKARATAPPIEPPPPSMTAVLLSSNIRILPSVQPPLRAEQAALRSSSTARSRVFWVSDAARSNSARASS